MHATVDQAQAHPLVFRPHPNVILAQCASDVRGSMRAAWGELARLGAQGSEAGECTLTRAILRIPQRSDAFSSLPAARRAELCMAALCVVDAWTVHPDAAVLTRLQARVLGASQDGWRALLTAAVSDVLTHERTTLARLLQAMRFPYEPDRWSVELAMRRDALGGTVIIHYQRGTAHARAFHSALEAALAWLADQVRAAA